MLPGRFDCDLQQGFALAPLDTKIGIQIHLIGWRTDAAGRVQWPVIRRDLEMKILGEQNRGADEQK